MKYRIKHDHTKKVGQKTFSEIRDIKRKELLDQEKKGGVYKKFKKIFSYVSLLEIKKKE